MCAELFKAEAGLDVAIIPYKGTAPLTTDLVGGHVPVAFGCCRRRSAICRRGSCAPSPCRHQHGALLAPARSADLR
jgi:tripartite-type tricarboxylate transporter receptor subunit TctC